MSAPKGAILQRDQTTFSIKPRTPLGVVDASTLRTLADIIETHDIPLVKMTSAQRLLFMGVREEDIVPIREKLGPVGEPCAFYVQACPGTDACRLALLDSMSMGHQLDAHLKTLALPAKLKVGVSSCTKCCGESKLRDVGLIGKKSGWEVWFGGNAGARPRVADKLAEGLDDAAAIACIDRVLAYWKVHGKEKERTARFVERVGVDAVLQAVS